LRRMTSRPKGVAASTGMAVDSAGDVAYDPSQNVLDLVEAERRRQDDLREAERRYFDAQNRHVEEILTLRALHAAELRMAESARLDSIRQVDREDVNKTAAQALNAIQTLATTTNTTAETLRNQVATTAQQAAQQRAIDTTEFNKRLSAVELALSEGKGKQTVADPMMAELVAEMKAMRQAQATGTGKTEGISASVAFAIAAAGVLLGIVGLVLSRLP